MPRIRPLRKDEVSDESARMLEASAERFGEPLVPHGIQAYCPPIHRAAQMLSGAPGKSGLLPNQLRSLVCLRVAQMVGCPF